MLINRIKSKEISKYFNNALWLILEKGVRVIDAFFIGIWIANYLGPDDYGIFSYSEAFVYLFTTIAGLGLDQIVVKELVKTPEKRDQIIGTAIVLRLIGFIAMVSIVVPVIYFQQESETTIYVIGLLSLSVAFQSFKIIDFYFQSEVKSKYTAICNIIVISCVALFKVYLIVNLYSLLWFAFAILIEWLLLAIAYIIVYKGQRLSITKWKYDKKIAHSLFDKGKLLILGSVAAALYMKIDQVMIKEFMSEYHVGIYSVAVKLAGVWLFITVIITQSIFPSLVALRKENRGKFIIRLQKLYDLLMKIAVMACVLYTVFGNLIIDILFGEAYMESSELIGIYIWSIVFVFLSNASWGYYLNEGLEKIASFRLILGALLNISLNVYLIKEFGLKGAAYATLISYSVSSYFINFMFKRTRENFYLQTKAIINILNPKTWIKPL
ncbi:O-antigen/teichoic acid export membrane protein [Nonlabens dokdonensis]|uniref:O-antigen/teichoic acid export membrane protein n=2 Tax=Nonlabens dokdonensis TaxID=328515 RepID=A0ABX5Q2E9_9FLAO|nr:flippase [Nonlabens dokdonensis]AGC76573.1 putative polysaccharide biosynthesis protein [Nonlabens dokdonensis DSW-6]PZX44224.1 O-antigen/teichoic acid export membrane protein [Nonlabens dokdonensis]